MYLEDKPTFFVVFISDMLDMESVSLGAYNSLVEVIEDCCFKLLRLVC